MWLLLGPLVNPRRRRCHFVHDTSTVIHQCLLCVGKTSLTCYWTEFGTISVKRMVVLTINPLEMGNQGDMKGHSICCSGSQSCLLLLLISYKGQIKENVRIWCSHDDCLITLWYLSPWLLHKNSSILDWLNLSHTCIDYKFQIPLQYLAIV